jgi:hypothetical protein
MYLWQRIATKKRAPYSRKLAEDLFEIIKWGKVQEPSSGTGPKLCQRPECYQEKTTGSRGEGVFMFTTSLAGAELAWTSISATYSPPDLVDELFSHGDLVYYCSSCAREKGFTKILGLKGMDQENRYRDAMMAGVVPEVVASGIGGGAS